MSHGVPQVGSNWGLGAASNQSTETLVRTLSVSELVQDCSEGLPWRYRGRGEEVGSGVGTGARGETGVGSGVGTGVKAGSEPVNGAALLSPSSTTVVSKEEQYNHLYSDGVNDNNTRTDLVGQGDSVLDMDRCSAAPLKLLSKFKRILQEKEAFRQVRASICDLLLVYGYKYCMS